MKKKVSWKERMLYVVFKVMLIVCGLVVLSMFIDNLYANHKMVSLTTEITQILNDNPPDDYKKVTDSFIEKLEAVSSCSMESNTVTFLLTVLSAGVIGYAVVLLERSHKKMAEIDDNSACLSRQVKEANKFISTGVAGWRLNSWLSKAKVMTVLLQSPIDEHTFENVVPQMRDLLFFVYIDLQDAIKREGPFESSQRKSLREITQDVKLDLESVPDDYRPDTESLIDYCDKILDLL
jgi:hypothetical protein